MATDPFTYRLFGFPDWQFFAGQELVPFRRICGGWLHNNRYFNRMDNHKIYFPETPAR
jgi:hypothetical protein